MIERYNCMQSSVFSPQKILINNQTDIQPEFLKDFKPRSSLELLH